MHKHGLSIIIPYYNTKKYCDELLKILDAQMQDNVQVILCDDGSDEKFVSSYDWLEVIHKSNGGVSSARNACLTYVKQDYVAFIDSDDLISSCYIREILEAIQDSPDFVYLSWKSFGGWEKEIILRSADDKFPAWNLCCWNRVYKWDLVKDIRFNEKKQIAEDAEYIREAETRCKAKKYIGTPIYFYRSDAAGSLTKRFADGYVYTHKIVYYYPKITADMDWLIKECKKINVFAEVIIMTEYNELPELEKYAMVMNPQRVNGTELRGNATPLFQKIELPKKTQVVIWTSHAYKIGGLETWIYNFVKTMHKLYDIIVMYDVMDKDQMHRVRKFCEVTKCDRKTKVICDTLIVNRITDEIPDCIIYRKKVQMLHSCRDIVVQDFHLKADTFVAPTAAVAKSYMEDIGNLSTTNVIKNFVDVESPKRVLRLVSMTRLSAEKGGKRMVALANMLNEKRIPFVWTVFTDSPFSHPPKNMIFMDPGLDVKGYISGCDYLVQLSDSEAFCYSIVEALMLGVPVITTPLSILPEIGVVDGENAIVVPFDMVDVSIDRIYESRLSFTYNFDNDEIVRDWINILGDMVPVGGYVPPTEILVTKDYKDLQLNRKVEAGERLLVTKERAQQICDAGYCVMEE